MSSFYGGKQGRTYHLVQHYDTIKIKNNDYPAFDASKKHLVNSKVKYNNKYYIFLEEVQASQETQELDLSKVREVKAMVDCFSQGGSYTEVNYGQYVIIDTPSKEDPENGCIYRRGFNYNEPTSSTIQNPGAGAIYIGKISGPTGKSPDIAATATVDTTATAISISHEAPSTDGAGNITTANLKFTFPAYSLSTTSVIAVAPDKDPSVVVKPNSTKPFAPNATIEIPVGRHGNSIDNIELKNGILTADITTYAKDNTSSTTTASPIGTVSYPTNISILTEGDHKGDVIQTFINRTPSTSVIGHFKTITSVVSKDSSIKISYNDGQETFIPIGSQFHVQGIYNSKQELENAYRTGFTGTHQGWIAVVNEVEDGVQKKNFYAYDHRQNSTVGWYKIGAIGTADIDKQIVPDKTMIISKLTPTSSSNLKVGGYWFVLSD